MDKKGFTLIELIAVIGLLAIIVVMVATSVISTMDKSEESLYETQIKTIEDAANNWGVINTDLMPMDQNDYIDVDIQTLVDDGFLDSADIVDPRDKSDMCGFVRITYSNNNYTYEFMNANC